MADRGLVVVVAGPDGAGKTALVDRLAGEVLQGPVRRIHHRPGVLPARSDHDGGPVTEPHAQEPYGRLPSTAKVLFVYADWVLGWALRVRPFVAGGGTVVIERGWWDMTVDQRRYRLAAPVWLLRLLGRLLPRPDHALLLVADPAVLLTRKAELAAGEMARQLRAWRVLGDRLGEATLVDVSRPLDEVVAAAAAALQGGPRQTHVTLPSPANPRFVVPTTTARQATGGLAIHQPMTPVGQVAWRLARAGARAGALRLVPGSHDLPDAVTSALDGLLPTGAVLSVGRATHPGRYAALVLDRRGRPQLLAKVALDDAGRLALEEEAAGHRRLAPLLQPPLAAPRIVSESAGVLVFEAVTWRPRWQPWRLPVAVAAGTGALYRAGGDADQGPAHSDLAPWNVLRGRDGRWYLIDWHRARLDAPPFTDVLHWLVQAHALLGRPRQDALVAGVVDGAGEVGAALAVYAAAAGLGREHLGGHLCAYLDRTRSELDADVPVERRALAARDALRAVLA